MRADVCLVTDKTTKQRSEVFSYRGLARWVVQNVWPRALLGGLILLVFVPDWRAFAAFGGLLMFTIAQDAYRYSRCWEKHNELERTYPLDYPPILEDKVREHGFETLIDRHWADLRVALKNKLGRKRMP